MYNLPTQAMMDFADTAYISARIAGLIQYEGVATCGKYNPDLDFSFGRCADGTYTALAKLTSGKFAIFKFVGSRCGLDNDIWVERFKVYVREHAAKACFRKLISA